MIMKHSDKSFSVRRYNGADITPFVTTQYYNPRFGLPKTIKVMRNIGNG